MRSMDGTSDFLIAAGDCPLLTPECIADLVARGASLNADFVYPIVQDHVMEQRYPGSRRTYRRFREGRFTGGNVFLVKRQYILGAESWLTKLFAMRKNPLAMGRLFGLRFLLHLISGTAPLSQIEQQVGTVLRGKIRALITEHAEVALDLDKPEDYHQLNSWLQRAVPR
jgi:CTP:molybdopterin cytidylyltransferase MocA